MTTGNIAGWLKKYGDPVKKGETLLRLPLKNYQYGGSSSRWHLVGKLSLRRAKNFHRRTVWPDRSSRGRGWRELSQPSPLATRRQPLLRPCHSCGDETGKGTGRLIYPLPGHWPDGRITKEDAGKSGNPTLLSSRPHLPLSKKKRKRAKRVCSMIFSLFWDEENDWREYEPQLDEHPQSDPANVSRCLQPAEL